MKKIIKLIVEIETNKDFNLDELAVGRYIEQENNNNKKLLLAEGQITKDDYFKVNDYLKVEDITNNIKQQRQQETAIKFLNNYFENDKMFDIQYEKLDKDEQKEIEKNIKQNI